MKVNRFLMVGLLLALLTAGSVSAADNATQSDASDNLSDEPDGLDEISVDENSTGGSGQDTYDGKYYLFRGDCWTVNSNFESSAAVTSETYEDLTVTGTFRTQSDLVGLCWNSKDLIEHPYISYGNRSDYSNVVLEFDYEMTGCMDFTASTITVAANTGETYYLPMARFIEDNHVKLDFNNITLLAGNSYFDGNGNGAIVSEKTKLDTSNLKYIMFSLIPLNFDQNSQTIIENTEFSCKISNITVRNGEISAEQTPFDVHDYRLCEGYDDVYNLNPLRLSKEMRKLGYCGWIDLYLGASYYYEKSGKAGDVIADLNLDHNRTEKMVLNKDAALNNAFRAWLDCYSRELKNNGFENLIISISMENLQCPQSWRQVDAIGNYAMSGWSPSTFLLSPCNDDAVRYMQNVSKACLDIVTSNGMRPILQMGESWWWWRENDWANPTPCFYDNATKAKYLLEHGIDMPEYSNVWDSEYDENVMLWLNQQLVQYCDALGQVISQYDDGQYLALFFTPSVIDTDRVPPMMEEVNYLKDAYSPSKLDVLQIEDYDWVIFESSHHNESYSIGKDLGFDEGRLHYFGGFVQYREDAARYWPLIEKAMEDAMENNFAEVFVWAGSQVRRDSKIIGYDEYVILHNLLEKNEPGFVSPIITSPDFVAIGENFTIKMHTDEWVNGNFNVYEYEKGVRGKLLSSNTISNGTSMVNLSADSVGLNRLYLEFDYIDGGYHLIQDVYVIENSKNITVDVSREVEIGHDANVTFKAPKNSSASAYVSVDDGAPVSYSLENGEFTSSISNLSKGYHKILVTYNGGYVEDGRLVGELYYRTFTVKVGCLSVIEASDVITTYGMSDNMIVKLKDGNGSLLKQKEISIAFNGSNFTLATDDDGQCILPIDLLPGNYTYEIFYSGDDDYISAFADVNVIVNRIQTNLNANNVNYVYGEAKSLVVSLKDINGNPLAGKNVIITLNKKVYNKTTDANGQVRISPNLAVNVYSADISFAGDGIYKSSGHVAKITVKKATSKLTASSKTFKVKAKTKKVTATLKYKNNAIKKAIVKLTVNKKTYKAKTNSKGTATFKIKITKKGKYTAVYKFSGNSNYNSATKKVKITIK